MDDVNNFKPTPIQDKENQGKYIAPNFNKDIMSKKKKSK